MDERVKRALEQWPDVPDVYNWLSLTRRGHWLLRNESVTNPNLIAFINRNYGPIENGGYAFQNGPQKVHVSLEATPWIARISDPDAEILSMHDQTGAPLKDIDHFWVTAEGDLIAQSSRGPALVHDNDLLSITRWFRDTQGQAVPDHELPAVLDDPAAAGLSVELGPRRVPVALLPGESVADHFGFDPQPRQPSAEN